MLIQLKEICQNYFNLSHLKADFKEEKYAFRIKRNKKPIKTTDFVEVYQAISKLCIIRSTDDSMCCVIRYDSFYTKSITPRKIELNLVKRIIAELHEYYGVRFIRISGKYLVINRYFLYSKGNIKDAKEMLEDIRNTTPRMSKQEVAKLYADHIYNGILNKCPIFSIYGISYTYNVYECYNEVMNHLHNRVYPYRIQVRYSNISLYTFNIVS